MRKIVFYGSAPIVGTDYCYGEFIEDNISDKSLDEIAWEYAIENVQMFGFDYDPDVDGDYETVTNGDDFEGNWAEYNPDEHDHLLVSNPFLEDQ